MTVRVDIQFAVDGIKRKTSEKLPAGFGDHHRAKEPRCHPTVASGVCATPARCPLRRSFKAGGLTPTTHSFTDLNFYLVAVNTE